MTFKNQQVLKNCSWEVKKGERLGLVGVNGAGKTTQLQVRGRSGRAGGWAGGSRQPREVGRAARHHGRHQCCPAPPHCLPDSSRPPLPRTPAPQIVMGKVTPDAGEVVKAKRNMRVAYLAQVGESV
jgi:hypothetical protein